MHGASGGGGGSGGGGDGGGVAGGAGGDGGVDGGGASGGGGAGGGGKGGGGGEGGGLGGGGLGDGGGGPTCCGFREHSLGSAAVARGVEPPSVGGLVVEHGVALGLVEVGHDLWGREVLVGGAARQPEVLRAIVEALQRPSIASVLEQVDDQLLEGRAARIVRGALQSYQLSNVLFCFA